MSFSRRISLIASLVPQGACVCDIGTDHGYLSILLKSSGRAKKVIATDLRPFPLENARKNLLKSGITDVDTRLCDGLDGVRKDEADTIVIAGMGGEVIAHILSNCVWLAKNPEPLLILQPTTSAEILRRFLTEHGFSITDEHALSDNGKLYSVMLCRYTGEISDFPEHFYYTGRINSESPDGFLYIKKQYLRFDSCAKALCGIPGKNEDYLKFKKLADSIGKMIFPETK